MSHPILYPQRSPASPPRSHASFVRRSKLYQEINPITPIGLRQRDIYSPIKSYKQQIKISECTGRDCRVSLGIIHLPKQERIPLLHTILFQNLKSVCLCGEVTASLNRPHNRTICWVHNQSRRGVFLLYIG